MTLPTRLPSIDGRAGIVIRAIYWLAFAATLIGIAGGVWFNARDRLDVIPTTVAFGFRTYLEDQGPIVGERAARVVAAGLEDGDRIVAVAGTPLPVATEQSVVALLKTAPAATTITVTRGGARIDARITRAPDRWSLPDPASGVPIWLFTTLSLAMLEAFPLMLLAASGLLAMRRARDAEVMLFATGFLGLCWENNVMQWLAAIAGWPLAIFPAITNFAWSVMLAAVAGFPDGRFPTRLSRIVALVAVVMAIANIPLRVSPTLALRFDNLWLSWAALVLVGAAAALILRYRSSAVASTDRQQMKWVMLGFTIACILQLVLVTAHHVAAVETGVADFLLEAIVSPLVYIAIPAGLLVSLLRYRLYDAESAISRSAAYAVLTVSLIAVFTGTEKVVELLGQDYFGNSVGTLAGGIGAAVMIAPLHDRIGRWAEHRFQRRLMRLRHGLPALVGDLRETATIEELASATIARLDREMRATGAALISEDRVLASLAVGPETIVAWRRGWTLSDATKLDCVRDDPVFPMRVPLVADGIGVQGWLLLGPRPDGSFYGKDERAFLADIADPVARAIAVVRRREKRERARLTERAALKHRIATIEAAVAQLMRSAPDTGCGMSRS